MQQSRILSNQGGGERERERAGKHRTESLSPAGGGGGPPGGGGGPTGGGGTLGGGGGGAIAAGDGGGGGMAPGSAALARTVPDFLAMTGGDSFLDSPLLKVLTAPTLLSELFDCDGVSGEG